MGDEQHRLAPLKPDPLKLQVEAFAGHCVQRAEGLVHQQQRGVVDQASADRHPLLHPTGKLPGVAVLKSLKADHFQKLERAAATVLAAELLHVDRQQHVVQYRAPGEENGRLEHDSDVPPRSGDLNATQLDLAIGCRKQTGEDF